MKKILSMMVVLALMASLCSVGWTVGAVPSMLIGEDKIAVSLVNFDEEVFDDALTAKAMSEKGLIWNGESSLEKFDAVVTDNRMAQFSTTVTGQQKVVQHMLHKTMEGTWTGNSVDWSGYTDLIWYVDTSAVTPVTGEGVYFGLMCNLGDGIGEKMVARTANIQVSIDGKTWEDFTIGQNGNNGFRLPPSFKGWIKLALDDEAWTAANKYDPGDGAAVGELTGVYSLCWGAYTTGGAKMYVDSWGLLKDDNLFANTSDVPSELIVGKRFTSLVSYDEDVFDAEDWPANATWQTHTGDSDVAVVGSDSGRALQFTALQGNATYEMMFNTDELGGLTDWSEYTDLVWYVDASAQGVGSDTNNGTVLKVGGVQYQIATDAEIYISTDGETWEAFTQTAGWGGLKLPYQFKGWVRVALNEHTLCPVGNAAVGQAVEWNEVTELCVGWWTQDGSKGASMILDSYELWKNAAPPVADFVVSTDVEQSAEIEAGEDVTVTVAVTSDSFDFTSGKVTLQYDADAFEVKSAVSALTDDDVNAMVEVNSAIAGKVVVSLISVEPIDLDGTLVTVVLTAKAVAVGGEKALTLTVDEWCRKDVDLSGDAEAVSVVNAAVTVKATVVEMVNGDVNRDGQVTTADARAVLQHVVGKAALTEDGAALADVNGDDALTTRDVRWILRRAVGKITVFPVEA